MRQRQEIIASHRAVTEESPFADAVSLFWDANHLTARLVQEHLGRGLAHDLEIPPVGLVNLGVHLLTTAYDTAMQGRFGASAHMMRSLGEIPDYLLAVHHDPQFGWDWWRETVNPPRTRDVRQRAAKAIAAAMGDDSEWKQSRHRIHEGSQPLSHVSATTARLSVQSSPDTDRVAVGPIGTADPASFKGFVFGLHWHACDLLNTCRLVLPEKAADPDAWHEAASYILTISEDLQEQIGAALKKQGEQWMHEQPDLREHMLEYKETFNRRTDRSKG